MDFNITNSLLLKIHNMNVNSLLSIDRIFSPSKQKEPNISPIRPFPSEVIISDAVSDTANDLKFIDKRQFGTEKSKVNAMHKELEEIQSKINILEEKMHKEPAKLELYDNEDQTSKPEKYVTYKNSEKKRHFRPLSSIEGFYFHPNNYANGVRYHLSAVYDNPGSQKENIGNYNCSHRKVATEINGFKDESEIYTTVGRQTKSSNEDVIDKLTESLEYERKENKLLKNVIKELKERQSKLENKYDDLKEDLNKLRKNCCNSEKHKRVQKKPLVNDKEQNIKNGIKQKYYSEYTNGNQIGKCKRNIFETMRKIKQHK